MSIPSSLINNAKLSSWIDFHLDGTVSLKSGKVELGQGISTSLMQIAADELGIDIESIRLTSGNTIDAPNEGWTSASISIEVGGKAIRLICSNIRKLCLAQASEIMGIDPNKIIIERGIFYDHSKTKSESYFNLVRLIDLHQPFNCVEGNFSEPENRYVGHSHPRIDLPRKIKGNGFIQDFVLPNMLHARILRGREYGSFIQAINETAIKSLMGVSHFVRDGQFIAICGENEGLIALAAKKARQHISWSAGNLAQLADFDEFIKENQVTPEIVHELKNDDDDIIVREYESSFSKPFLAHASIGTVCAVADYNRDKLRIWTQSQGVYPLRACIAKFFGMREDFVEVVHIDGSGCYGHNGADDVALDASIISVATKRPVRVVWSREDELGVAPFGSAMRINLKAGLNVKNKIVSWTNVIFSLGHLIRPGWGDTVNLLAATEVERSFSPPEIKDPPMTPFGGGAARNSVPLYDFKNSKVELNLVKRSPIRTSALRALGAFANVFAMESFIDDLAHDLGQDPIDFRLSHLSDERARKVIETVVRECHYQKGKSGMGDWGHGFAFAQYKNNGAYFAIHVEVDLSETVRISKVTAAVDAGEIINPDFVRNQIEGGIIQAISWTIKEEVSWSKEDIENRSWENYPIIGFSDIPSEIDVHILERSDYPSFGVGECAAGPVAGAIGNAIFNALGVRIRDLPMTYERIAKAFA